MAVQDFVKYHGGNNMRVVLINSNIVTNTIEADHLPTDHFGADLALVSDIALIGDTYINGEFVSVPLVYTPIDIVPSLGNVVPEITTFQAKAALAQFGLLDTIETYMETADTLTRLRWQTAPSFRRDNPALLTIAADLGITDQQLDDLFALGATITL